MKALLTATGISGLRLGARTPGNENEASKQVFQLTEKEQRKRDISTIGVNTTVSECILRLAKHCLDRIISDLELLVLRKRSLRFAATSDKVPVIRT